MRGIARYLLPLCLVTALGGCAGGYYNDGSSGYASSGYYGDYSYAPSYGLGFTYYGDGGGYNWHHGAPHNDWQWHGNAGGNDHDHDQWRWHSASNGWQKGGSHH